jgi:predicted nuclease of predicted toxin-antitoxin system
VKRILLDECIPRKFNRNFGEHECVTVSELGLAGKKNGELLSLAEAGGFQVFITLDRGIAYQQNLSGRRIAVVLIRTKSNRLADLIPHAVRVLEVVNTTEPGQIIYVP